MRTTSSCDASGETDRSLSILVAMSLTACNPADMQTTGPGIGGAVRVIKGMGKTSKPKEIVAGLLGRRRSQRKR